MSDEAAPGPFSEFAAPKKSSVDEWRERQDHERRSRQGLIGALCWLVIGATIGSSTGSSIQNGFESLPIILIASPLGAILGCLIGALIAIICFSIMAMPFKRGSHSFESRLVENNPALVIKVYMAFWITLGIAVGAGLAAYEASSWYLGTKVADMGGIIGAVAGVLLAGTARLIWKKRQRDTASRLSSDKTRCDIKELGV
jgi:hypothetical protein